MRNKLMITTAMAALIGCTTLAVAQETKEAPSKAAPSAQGAQQHPGGGAPGGAMSQPGGAMKPGSGAAQNTTPKAGAEQQGQAQERSGQGTENHGVSQSEQSNPNSATNRRGAQEERGTQEQRGAQSQEQRGAQSNEQRGAQSNEPSKTIGAQQRNAQGAAPKAGGGASVQLSQEQRTKIKDVIVKDRNVARVDHVDFSVSVGVAVPRTVHVAVLPADVVTIVPEYRGFDYIIVGDQLLIIDPHTMEIVYILPA
jgi:Protein of unknown function (DUF1236)